MSGQDDGGPASTGMSLRDYFAAKADPGLEGISVRTAKELMGSDPPGSGADREHLENIRWWMEAEARWSYMKADAMLKAREAK